MGVDVADDGLPQWMENVTVVCIDSAEDIHQVIMRFSKSPCLEIFGSGPFSKEWTLAGGKDARAK